VSETPAEEEPEIVEPAIAEEPHAEAVPGTKDGPELEEEEIPVHDEPLEEEPQPQEAAEETQTEEAPKEEGAPEEKPFVPKKIPFSAYKQRANISPERVLGNDGAYNPNPHEEEREDDSGDSTFDDGSEASIQSSLDMHVPELIQKIRKLLDPEICAALETFVRTSDSTVLFDFSDTVRTCWDKVQNDGKEKMFQIPDCKMSVSVISKKKNLDDLRKSEIRNNSGAFMNFFGSGSWTSLVLVFEDSRSMELSSAFFEEISEKSFSPSDWKIVRNLTERLKERQSRGNA